MNKEENNSFTDAQLLRMKAEAQLKLKENGFGSMETDSEMKK